MQPITIRIDFETRSEINLGSPGKPGVGAWVYSQHPTTEVLCMAYRVNGGLGLWTNEKFTKSSFDRTQLPVYNLEQYPLLIRHDYPFVIEAHNAPFERAIWQNIMVPKFGWPEVPLEQWRCSAAKCSAAALPRSLEKACAALGLPEQKDKGGHALMMKMCKPRNPLKGEKIAWLKRHFMYELDRGRLKLAALSEKKYLLLAESQMPTLWHEEPQQLLRLFKYCIQDVEAQHCLSEAVRDLDLREQELWVLDQQINERGFLIDIETVEAVLDILEARKTSLLDEVAVLTGGRVRSPQQTAESLKWLAEQGLVLPNMQAKTIKEALERE